MGAGKDKAETKSAEKPLKADMRQVAGDIQDYNTSRPVTPINDIRKHPDANLSAAIATMSFSGFDARRVCSALRISPSTLFEHYRDEFENGCSNMVNDIAQSLAQRAKAGSDTAAIFLLKTRGGGKFSERQQVELSGSVEVTHKAALIGELSAMLSRGITIDGEAEPVDEKKEGA
jgi:hypothetical protein